jgi:hypothetical protein
MIAAIDGRGVPEPHFLINGHSLLMRGKSRPFLVSKLRADLLVDGFEIVRHAFSLRNFQISADLCCLLRIWTRVSASGLVLVQMIVRLTRANR